MSQHFVGIMGITGKTTRENSAQHIVGTQLVLVDCISRPDILAPIQTRQLSIAFQLMVVAASFSSLPASGPSRKVWF